MKESSLKSKTRPLKVECNDWNSRFVYDSGQIGTKSLPSISSKPYISLNGSEVKSVLKTKAKENKRRKSRRDKEQVLNLDIISSPIISACKEPIRKKLQRGKKVSIHQQGKIKSLRSRARPLSLPLLRDVQSPLPLGVEKSYSARDSSSRASMLKIDVSLNMESSKELKQWQDFQEITEDSDGNDLRHLVKLNCIGRGASAYVYKSVLFPSLEVVADKVIVVASQEKSSQIMRELQSLRMLLNGDEGGFCQNIVRLIEVYPNPRDGTISICLEYMDGGSLEDVVSTGGCQDEVVLAGLSRQIIGGISYLHSHRHIHRDIKPGNILLTGNPRHGEAIVKISDFGISKELEKGHSLADSFLGTFHYMSPERIAGKDYSFSSDIWGCGLSILAVAMGCYPFSKRLGKRSQKLNAHRRRVGVENGKAKEDVGVELDHSGGYWHILQSISQRPSINELLGNSHPFSSRFCQFLSMSLHRDQSSRASAETLLSHSFLGDLSSQSRDPIVDKKQTKYALERDALRQFAVRCCRAQRSRISEKSSSSSRLLPSLKTNEIKSTNRPGEIHLNFVRVTLGSDQSNRSDCDSCYEYVSYNVADLENINYFFTMLAAYKDFTAGNWIREKEDGYLRSARSNSQPLEAFSRVKVLQLLLDSTLCVELHGSSSFEILRDCNDLIEFSPCLAPLFDRVVLRNLAEQLNVSMYIVVICLRDFVMELLHAEELSDEKSGYSRSEGVGVSTAGITVPNSTSVMSVRHDNDVSKGMCPQEGEDLVKISSSTVSSASGVSEKEVVHGDAQSTMDDAISLLRIDSAPKCQESFQKCHVLDGLSPDGGGVDSTSEDFYEDDFDS